jgi:hypothetical protein
MRRSGLLCQGACRGSCDNNYQIARRRGVIEFTALAALLLAVFASPSVLCFRQIFKTIADRHEEPPVNRLVCPLAALLCLAAGGLGLAALAGCTTPSAPGALDVLPPTESRAELLAYVNHQADPPDGPRRYEAWQLFPDSAVGDPLGLPVHGRFTTVYANDVAHAAAEKWLGAETLGERVDFPARSILVKANTFVDPKVEPDVAPGVLTIMYKPGIAGYCQTDDHWSADGCYGDGWMFVFYEVPNGPLAEMGAPGKDLTADVVPRDFCVTCHAGGAEDDYVRSLQRLRRAAQTPTRPGAPSGTPVDPGPDPFCQAPVLGPTLPPDVAMDPTQIEDPAQRQRMFDCLSWRTFIALNWPVAATQRGEPDTAAELWNPTLDGYVADSGVTDPADFHPRTRVWETYQEVYELFQTGPGRFDWNPSTAEPPLAWNDPAPDPVGAGCDGVDGGKVLMMVHKNRTPLPPPPRPGEGVVNEGVQAFAGQFGVLVDQNGRLVRYDVRLNRSEFEFILANGFATTAAIGPGGPNAALATELTLPDDRSPEYGRWGGSIELKGSWRELCTDPATCTFTDDPTRYFTESVWIYEADASGAGTCRPAVMGLVGLHIAHKTHWAPQWVWSTFEHVDLVPENPDVPGARRTALFDPACVAKAKTLGCENKPFLAAGPCCPNVPFDKDELGQFTPNQVTRLQAIGSSAAALNSTFAGLAAGSPFENYVLIDTQWPFQGRVPGDEERIYTRPCNSDALRGHLDADCYTIVPQFLRNTSMESYMASYYLPGQPLHQFSNRGCMNCHGEAGADFSYVWLDAVNQRVRSVVE